MMKWKLRKSTFLPKTHNTSTLQPWDSFLLSLWLLFLLRWCKTTALPNEVLNIARAQSGLTYLSVQVCLFCKYLWCIYWIAALRELLHECSHLRVWILEAAILDLSLGSINYLLCEHDDSLNSAQMNQTGPCSPGLWDENCSSGLVHSNFSIRISYYYFFIYSFNKHLLMLTV